MKKIITSEVKKLAEEFNKENNMIENIEPIGCKKEWWDVEHNITDILIEAFYNLQDLGIISEDENYKYFENIIDNLDVDIRNIVFKILTKPIVHFYNNNKEYSVEVDEFWERVYIVNEMFEDDII